MARWAATPDDVGAGRRFGGIPLVVYVTALIAIPFTGLLVLGGQELRRDDAAAQDARTVAETIEHQTTAIAVLPPLQIERIVALGSARVQELGIDTADIDPAVGAELIALLAGNADELDAGLQAFDEVLVETGATDLSPRLTESRREIDQLRIDLGSESAAVDEVTAVYESVLGIIDEFLADTTEVFSTNPAAFDAERLILEHTLGGLVLRTANDEVGEIANVFVGDGEFDLRSLIAAESRHVDTLDQMLGVTDNTGPIDELLQVRSALSPFLVEWVEDGPLTSDNVVLRPELYNDYLALIAERLTYLSAVEQFVDDVGDDIIVFADNVADRADGDRRTTLIGLTAIALGVLIFEFAIFRSFAGPLRRLRDQAGRIGRGDLAVEPLPVDGPSDIRRVTAAVNDMASTLVSVDGHLTTLATGTPADSELSNAIPGPVGASIRDSVGRLTALTTDLQLSEERLQDEARHDGLTTLFNRFGAIEHVESLVEDETAPFAIFIVDLDGFKNVNDTNGQAVGDRILLEVARRLSELVGDAGIVARIGGDEFLVVTPTAADEQRAIELGRRIIETIERPHGVGDLRFSLSASVGARIVEPEAAALEVVEQADAAVYHAKRRGRGRVEMYDADLQTAIEQEAEIELALRRGIAEGELRLFLQPAADLRTGEVTGAEALVRWARESADFVSPGEFVPIAERSGLILMIDRWVLEHSCRRIAEWQRRDPDCRLRIAVNVSGRHLTEGDLLADLDAALASTGADPQLLEIELTESQMLDDIERVVSVLDGIRSRGIAISVDDFGTGYSSMTYLQRLPLDAVKIDRSFVAGAPDRDFDAMVIESIVRLAAALSLDVVAEGVETIDQLRLVRDKGVHRVQGFLLARPMPVDEAERVIFDEHGLDLAAHLNP